MSAINEIKSNLALLIPRLNTSVASVITRIIDVCGTIIDIVRLEILRSEQVIQESIKRARITSQPWYLEKAYQYQDGDDLVIIDPSTQEIGYDEINPSKQIIKQANIGTTALGIFYLNVATTDNNNNIVSLSQAQLSAFRIYYQNFVAMGAQVSIASNPPAVFDTQNLYITYDGKYNLNTIKQNINTALHDLQTQRRTIGRLYVNEIEIYLINNIPGIHDAYFSDPRLIYEGRVSYPTNGSFELAPGYFNFASRIYDFNQNITIFTTV